MKAAVVRKPFPVPQGLRLTSGGVLGGTAIWPWVARLGAGAWTVAVFLLWMPYAVQFPGVGLDASWLFGLVMAFNRRMQWGHDIVFTYGPLAAMEHGGGFIVDPNLWPASLVFAVAVNLVFAVCFAFFMRAFDAHPLTWGLALLVLLLPVPVWALPEIELLLVTIMVFTLAVRLDRGGPTLAAFGGVLIAVQVLDKGTLLIAGGGILAAFATAAWIIGRRRLMLPALITTLVFILALYLAAGQSLGWLVTYLRTIYELAAGYSPAMSTFADQPPEINPGLARLSALALVPVAAGVALIAFRRRNRGLLTLALICVPMMFLSFKEGFVRWHIDYFVTIAVLMQLLTLVAILGPRRPPSAGKGPGRLNPETVTTASFWRRRASLVGMIAVAALLLGNVALAMMSLPSLNQSLWPADTLGDRLTTYQTAANMLQDSAARDQMARREEGYVLAEDPIPEAVLARIGRATVDVMPWDVDVIAANHLNWTPRPVLGSYTSYTGYLDDMDASFFRSTRAPEYLLTTYRVIDNRYALFEEPSVQRALLEHYRVDDVSANWVLLRRATGICPCAVRELGSTTAATGQAVKTPIVGPDERLFAAVRLDYSPAGRAANLVFDTGVVRVKLTSGGTELSFRLVTSTARDGLLLSDLASTPAALATVYSGCRTAGSVESIRVEPDNALMFASTVTYDFFAEQTGPCDRVAVEPQA